MQRWLPWLHVVWMTFFLLNRSLLGTVVGIHSLVVTYAPCLSAETPTEEYLDHEELEFLNSFDALMEACFYTRLSKAEWETADREEFTVSCLLRLPQALALSLFQGVLCHGL